MSRLLHANVGVIDPVFPYVPNDFGFAADGDTTPFLRNLVCKIGGTDRSGYVRSDSMSGTLQMEGRDQLQLELIDTTDTYRPTLAETVEVFSNTNLLFRGTITDLDEHYEIDEDRKVRHIDVRCSGAGHALDRRLVFGEVPGNYLFSVLIQTLQPSGVHDDLWGFYDFQPFPGPAIEAQRVNGSTALQFVQRAVNAAGEGWSWWLDWNGNYPQLHVRDLSSDPIDAPWDATDSSGNIHEVIGVERDDSEYANRVYVRMGSESVSTVKEQFIGGTFAEDVYALDYTPLEMISITVEGVSQTFGVKSELWDTGDDTSLEWYYQPIGYDWWQNQIWRGPEQAAIGVGDVIEVTYRAQTGSYVRADDTTEQAARKAIMGWGSGIVEKILEVKDIPTEAAAQQYADAMLAKLKSAPTVVRYTSFRHGLKPGQTQTITLSQHGIDGEYNISSIRFREVAGSYEGSDIGIEYTVEATSATRAVPHPLRLHEDIIDAIRGAQEVARVSGGASGTGAGGAIIPIWEVPRGAQDGTNRTFYSSLLPEVTEYNVHGIIATHGGRWFNPFAGDYVVTPETGEILYASGLQPQPSEDHHIVYWAKGSAAINNPALGARLFAGGSDLIDWGAHAAHFIQGDLSIGIWIKLNSSSADDQTIITRGVDGGAITQYGLMVSDQGGEWGIRYYHDDASNNQQIIEYDLGLDEEVWYYIGISRDSTTKAVLLYLGDGQEIIRTVLGTYVIPPGGSDTGTRNLGIGNGFGTFGGAALQATVQESYIAGAVWSKPDHASAMLGAPPSSGLVHASRLLGASPEVDESATGASGTVTGTTVVQGRI